MTLRSDILVALSREPSRLFKIDDICELISAKKTSVAPVLGKLCQNREISRMSHGVYQISTEFDKQPKILPTKISKCEETEKINELIELLAQFCKSPGRIPPSGLWAQVFTPQEIADLRTKEESDQGPGEVVIEKMLGIREKLGTRDPKTRSGGCDIASTEKQTFIQQKHVVNLKGALCSFRAGIESTNAYFSAIHNIFDLLDQVVISDAEKSSVRRKFTANLKAADIITLPFSAQQIIRENLCAEKVLCVGKVQHVTLTTNYGVVAFPKSLLNKAINFYSVSSARVNFRVNIEFIKHMIKTIKNMMGLTIDIRLPAFSQGSSSVSREYSKDLFTTLAEQASERTQLFCPRVEMPENKIW